MACSRLPSPSCSVAKQSLPPIADEDHAAGDADLVVRLGAGLEVRVRGADLRDRVGARHADRVRPRRPPRAAVPASPAGRGSARGRRRARRRYGSGGSRSPGDLTGRASRAPRWLALTPAASSRLQVEREVEDRRRVREPADRQVVDAGRGDLARAVEREVARGLELDRLGPRPAPRRRPRAAAASACCRAAGTARPRRPPRAPAARVSASTWMGTSGNRARTASIAARHRAGGDHVVVLDHRDVVQAHALVRAAAAAHRVLLQRAQPRGRLAGVEHLRARALQRVRPPARVRRDARRAAGQVEQGPLGDEEHLDPARAAPRGRRRAPPGSPSATRCSTVGAAQPEPCAPPGPATVGTSTSPATTPASRATRSAVPIASGGMVACVVTSRPGAGPRSSSSAMAMVRATQSGSSAVGLTATR